MTLFAKYPFMSLIWVDAFNSAIDGPDKLAEELDLVTKMKIAVNEERYSDAGIIGCVLGFTQ